MSPKRSVWCIPQTGEIFVDYQSYLDRLDFYKMKHFSCEITGHMNLSFFEALTSETNSSHDVDQTFPEALKDPVLRKVQFSIVSRIDTLVDQLHESFKSDFYPGEHVTAILSTGDRVEALVREKTMFPELRYANGDIQRKGFSRYTVKLINRNDEEAQVDNEHLVRDKKSFTKAMLRSFIKNTVSREPWNGAPWLVKEDFAVKYKIPQNVPPHLQRANTAAERKAAQARKKQEQNLNTIATNGHVSPTPASPADSKPISKSHKSKSQQAAIKMSKLLQAGNDAPSETSVSGSPWRSSPNGTPEGGNKTNFKAVIKEETPPPPPPPPKPIKYPIEDLDLLPQTNARRPILHYLSAHTTIKKTDALIVDAPAINRRVSRASTRSSNVPSASPAPTTNGIDEEKVQFYLSTWVFLNIYCEPLILDSFTFDDYLQALEFSNEELDCELFVEIHCALLKAIVNEQGVVQAQLPDPEEEEEEEEEEGESEEEGEESETGSQGNAGDVDGEKKGDRQTSLGKAEEKEKKHRADELFGEGESWIQRLKMRDFKNGGWQAIIVGLLHQLSNDTRFAKHCEEVLAHLAPVNENPTPDTVKQQYLTLDMNLRVIVLHLLCRLTHETRSVRDYMEECAEEMTKHRKEKIEVQRTRKALLEELKSYDDERKILLPENTPHSPSPLPASRQTSTDADGDSKMNGVDDDEGEDDDEDEGEGTDRGRSLRRGGERANERKRKREEEKERADAAAKVPKTSKQFQKVLKAIESTKAKIAKQEEKIASFDEDLRQADCARFKMMGRDRFWNKYWWFERNGMPFGGLPSSSTADSGYANAMIWVQGPDPTEREGFLEEEAGTKDAIAGEDVKMKLNGGTEGKMSVLERQAREEGPTILTSPTQYGYIETVEEFDQLMSWLDIKGIREKKLKLHLEEYRKHIEEGMRNRQLYLAGATSETTEKETNCCRMATRGKTSIDPSIWRCLNWTNSAMIDEEGHTHYDHPQPRKGKKKGSAQDNKGVPLNKQGKPVSRQGERYNF
ncbi:hypothetical protein RUND412_004610 [Rhizina undulata]